MRKLHLIIIFMLCLAGQCMAQNYTQAQVRQRIASAAAKTQTLTCDFVQAKSVKMLKRSIVSRGKMWYAKPSKLRWEYVQPYKYVFLLNGNTVTLKNSGGSTKMGVAQNKMFQEIARIMMGSVLGSSVKDSRDFSVRLSGRGNDWQAVLTPKRNPMKQMFKTVVVHFDMAKALVSKIVMTEKGGDMTVITLKNVRLNSNIHAQTFSLR